MFELLSAQMSTAGTLAQLSGTLSSLWNIFLIVAGFEVVIFFHELGHFGVAKWAGIRVEAFCVGFGPEIVGFTLGETRYSLKVLPLGGYVKMLGQEDFEIDKSGELTTQDDPRSFINKSVPRRMAVVSAGVVMNLIVAALLFMVVYMIGKEEVVPIVGQVISDSPAAKAGVQAGDRVVAINDFRVSNFNQISFAVRLAKPYESLVFELERDGELIRRKIVPETNDLNWLQVGIAPGFTNEVVYVSPEYTEQVATFPKPGDVIVEVNGTPIDEAMQLRVWASMLQGRNKPSTMIVERSDPNNPGGSKVRVTIEVPKTVGFIRNGLAKHAPRDLLGLQPRIRISGVSSKSAAGLAGFREHDVIVRWGNILNPTVAEIYEDISTKDGRDIPVTVRRKGIDLPKPLLFRPVHVRAKDGTLKPKIGCKFIMSEQSPLVLAGVTAAAFDTPTPASKTELVKGCRLIALDGEPIDVWADLVERLRQRAGSDVEIAYLPPDSTEQRITTLQVPECLSSLLDMPSYAGPFQRINFLLDGRHEIKVSYNDKEEYLPAYHPLAIRYYLSQHLGGEVKVTFQDEDGSLHSDIPVAVTSAMIDPWYRRVVYSIPEFQTSAVTYINQELNPLKAIWAGTMQTYYFVTKTYLTLRRLIFDRTVGIEHMSGPVGIVRIGSRIAKADKIEMLFFLALISANLAVLNFLPLPIVDGGLMVFLLIELIKGSPVGIRTQVATQLIGIALFATMFILITFKDIADWIG